MSFIEGSLASGSRVSHLGFSMYLLCDLMPFLSLSVLQFLLPETLVSSSEALAPFYLIFFNFCPGRSGSVGWSIVP